MPSEMTSIIHSYYITRQRPRPSSWAALLNSHIPIFCSIRLPNIEKLQYPI